MKCAVCGLGMLFGSWTVTRVNQIGETHVLNLCEWCLVQLIGSADTSRLKHKVGTLGWIQPPLPLG